MATITGPPVVGTERRMVLPHVGWETYERLLSDDGERRVPRLTYDRGVLELVSPSTLHEEDAQTIILLVEIVAAILDIPLRNVGSMTCKRADLEQAFEPDGSFYIQHEARVRRREQIDPAVDPPPDLVLELEVSRSAIDKLDLFARMGIPEVWRSRGSTVAISVLDNGTYRDAPTSRAIPGLSSAVVTRFLAESRTRTRPDWFRTVSAWAAAQGAGDGASTA